MCQQSVSSGAASKLPTPVYLPGSQCVVSDRRKTAAGTFQTAAVLKVWFQKSANSKIIPLKMFTARPLSPATGEPHVPHYMC